MKILPAVNSVYYQVILFLNPTGFNYPKSTLSAYKSVEQSLV